MRTKSTTAQLLSALTSYPGLQDLALHDVVIPYDGGDGFAFQVPLRRLKKLELRGVCDHVLRLLSRLGRPDALDRVHLNLAGYIGRKVSEILGPYLQN